MYYSVETRIIISSEAISSRLFHERILRQSLEKVLQEANFTKPATIPNEKPLVIAHLRRFELLGSVAVNSSSMFVASSSSSAPYLQIESVCSVIHSRGRIGLCDNRIKEVNYGSGIIWWRCIWDGGCGRWLQASTRNANIPATTCDNDNPHSYVGCSRCYNTIPALWHIRPCQQCIKFYRRTFHYILNSWFKFKSRYLWMSVLYLPRKKQITNILSPYSNDAGDPASQCIDRFSW